MNRELEGYLLSLPRLLMVKTHEEDRLIQELHSSVPEGSQLKVWNSTFGAMDSGAYIDEWNALRHPEDKQSMNPHMFLQEVYTTAMAPGQKHMYYVMLDADRFLQDGQLLRRFKNLAISASHNDSVMRTLILVSSTGNVPAVLDPFMVVHDFDDPSDELIRTILHSIEAEIKVQVPTFTLPEGREGNDIPEEFIAACRGMSVNQIKEAILHFGITKDLSVSLDDMRELRKGIIKKTNLLELMETNIGFDDIAGLDKLKSRLQEIQTAWTPEGREYGVPVSRGLLQVGIPGCGKSMIAKALAKEMGITFVKFDPSNLFSSRVGDSEANMRLALKTLESVAPCVVFIDEIEKGLAGIQSSSYSDSGTTARVIGTFLSWFQDHSEDIFIIATANNINSLPPELISRFEEKYFVGMPGTQARENCFRLQCSKYWKDSMGSLDDLDFKAMAEASGELTGREIEQVVMDSIRKAFVSPGKKVTTPIVLEAITSKPPLVQTMAEPIQEMLDWVGWDSTRQEGIRARYASSEEVVEAGVAGSTFEDSSEANTKAARLFGKKGKGLN